MSSATRASSLLLTYLVEAVAFNHALERGSVNAEDARRRLLVAARAGEHARDVPPFKLGEREQRAFGVRGRIGGSRGRRGSHALRQVFGAHRLIAQSDGAHARVLKLAYVAGPFV